MRRRGREWARRGKSRIRRRPRSARRVGAGRPRRRLGLRVQVEIRVRDWCVWGGILGGDVEDGDEVEAGVLGIGLRRGGIGRDLEIWGGVGDG